MNIQQAKQEIVRTLHAYTKKDARGAYRIPIDKQRPVLLIGPPGIGKTAIMEQIAEEASIGLVAYTMTHHTRQSAIGLPVIREKVYADRACSVTEYTMSEIIASLYEEMEATGRSTGILFLDEINCVSETLAPVMLQLLQNKQFGTHRMPEGWLIVAAGNPPEYNKSVREFDMATLDRVKNIEVEADLDVWQTYAVKAAVHQAIRAYLTVHPEHFYLIQEDRTQKLFVTARGWEDLSCILKIYEEDQEAVTEEFILEYVQHPDVARDFYLFYDLFSLKLQTADQEADSVTEMLQEGIREMQPVECIAAASMLATQITERAQSWQRKKQEFSIWQRELEEWKKLPMDTWNTRIEKRTAALEIKKQHNLITLPDLLEEEQVIRRLAEVLHQEERAKITGKKEDEEEAKTPRGHEVADTYDHLEHYIRTSRQEMDDMAQELSDTIEQSYQILEQAGETSALSYFTADMTRETAVCDFLLDYPSEKYTKHGRC